MIKVYLCDDNDILLEKYFEQITGLAKKHQIEVALQTFSSGEQLLFHLDEDANAADIIYLDIIMDGLNGIETAKRLRQMGCHSEIIFLTSSKEYVFDSFDTNPLHYILKDSSPNGKFEEVFLRAVDFAQVKANALFHCESGAIKKQIPFNRIAFFEAQNRTIVVHYEKKTFEFYSTMEKLEQELVPKNFIRCHRSYMINLKFIDEIEKNQVTLITGDVIPVGITYNKELKLAFSSCLADMF